MTYQMIIVISQSFTTGKKFREKNIISYLEFRALKSVQATCYLVTNYLISQNFSKLIKSYVLLNNTSVTSNLVFLYTKQRKFW